MKKFEWYVQRSELSYGRLLPLYQLYWWLFKPKGYKEHIEHSLVLGEKYLSHYRENAILWHIEKERLSHLALPKTIKPSTLFDNSYAVTVFTKDNDQYAFDCTLDLNALGKIKIDIEKECGS